MIPFIDDVLGPVFWALLTWSARWGGLIAALAAWFRVRPPRRAATRHLLVGVTLAAGLLLPLAPTWTAPWPRSRSTLVSAPEPPIARPEPAPPVEWTLPVEFDRSSRPVEPSPAVEPGQPDPVARPTAPGRQAIPEAGRASTPQLGPGRVALLTLAAVWLAATAGFLARLAAGRWALARIRRSATPVEGAGRATFEAARRDARLDGRAVGLATHPGVGSPIVLGGRRPTVLVPDDWAAWPPASQRACLLHELAHLGRRDDAWKLLAELIRAPFWFHPGVAWLQARLDREAELACDEATVAQGVLPRDLARLLLDFARRPHRLDPRDHRVVPSSLAFFGRATVSTRITRLLEDDMPRTSTRPPRIQLLGLVTLLTGLSVAIGGARVGAIEPPPVPPPQAPQAPSAAPGRSFTVVVKDAEGRPVEGATVAAGVVTPGSPPDVTLSRTGADGVARFDRRPQAGIWVVASKPGSSFASRNLFDESGAIPTPLTLPAASPLVGTVNDNDGRPIEGAEVRVDGAHPPGPGPGGIYLAPNLADLARGTPIEEAIVTRSGREGQFRFDSLPASARISLVASAEGRATAHARAATAGPADAGQPVRIVLTAAARVAGRVESRVPGVALAGRTVLLRGIFEGSSAQIDGRATTDADGRFEVGGLAAGRANLILDGVPADGPWTFVAARAVQLIPGSTTEARIEIVAGAVVAGTVASTDGKPLAGVAVMAYGARNPINGSDPIKATTDAAGAYRFRLPPGNATIMLNGQVAGHAILSNGKPDHDVIVPADGVTLDVRPILLAPATKLVGRIVDAAGAPIFKAWLRVVNATNQQSRTPIGQGAAMVDAEGRFSLETQLDGQPIAVGQSVTVQVRLDDGREFDSSVVPNRANSPVTIKLPAFAAGGPRGPEQVAVDEVAGVVVDPQGRPIEGALIHPISWIPNFQTRSDRDGRFRVKVSRQSKMEVRVTRDGYEPREFLKQPVGQPGWVVVLDNRTYFEGRVLAPDGSPVADAPIRADSGMKQLDGGIMSDCLTDGRSGPDGRYRLYVEPGLYEFQVRVPGAGVLRLGGQAIGTDEVVPLDLRLARGVQFEARVVHSLTGAPVAGYLLENFRNPGIRGTSDAAGVVRIADMMPGSFEFTKLHDDTDYARWWSDACTTEWSRFQPAGRFGFQRNLDALDFDIQPVMAAVTITVEPATTIRGVVLDPDGQPVAGATVAPALTGSGNSLTGDTRFSVPTGPDGTYTMKLPASGAIAYNLVAHDGKFMETRTWGNGVNEPFKTTPGQVLDCIDLRLTRPATVRGRVVDAATGRPIANREVRASAADKRENRYYDPTTKTEADGSFTLRCIRPGEQFIQAAPFWLYAADAPNGTTQATKLAEGETREDVVLRTTAQGR